METDINFCWLFPKLAFSTDTVLGVKGDGWTTCRSVRDINTDVQAF